MFSELPYIFEFPDRTVSGGRDSGNDVCDLYGILQMPYAMLIGVLIAFTALIPIFGAFIGCVVGAFLILTVAPMKALVL